MPNRNRWPLIHFMNLTRPMDLKYNVKYLQNNIKIKVRNIKWRFYNNYLWENCISINNTAADTS